MIDGEAKHYLDELRQYLDKSFEAVEGYLSDVARYLKGMTNFLHKSGYDAIVADPELREIDGRLE